MIYGPFDRADWITMLAFKQVLTHLKGLPENEQRKFIIRHEKKKLDKYLRRRAA